MLIFFFDQRMSVPVTTRHADVELWGSLNDKQKLLLYDNELVSVIVDHFLWLETKYAPQHNSLEVDKERLKILSDVKGNVQEIRARLEKIEGLDLSSRIDSLESDVGAREETVSFLLFR